jgi:hypothetical protein
MKTDDLRRAVSLWVGYLRLARLSDRSDVRDALKKSASFYKRWDNFEEEPFEEWWKTHSYMFEDKIVSVRPPSEGEENDSIPSPSKNDLLLFIPLERTTTELLKEVKVLIAKQKRKATKPKRRSTMQELAQGKSPQIDQLADKLAIGSIVCEHGKIKPRALLNKVYAHFKTSDQKLPMALQWEPGGDLLRALRNLDRYVKGADQVMLNVANGRFPGRMTKDTQVS